MRRVAILIPASPNDAFYSQLAAKCLALGKLNWQRWQPTVYGYFGGPHDAESEAAWRRWLPHLRELECFRVSDRRFHEEDNWAQVEATIELASRQADVIMSMDADTLPVRNFESVLDQVAEADAVAGVIAHFPVPPAKAPRQLWAQLSELIGKPVPFDHSHSLVFPTEPDERREAPFYVNGGVVFYARAAFNRFAPRYLELRQQVRDRLEVAAFSGQVALTLAVVAENIRTLELPIRYNMPNDPIVERLHPDEVAHSAIYHYLRTTEFDRHRIFTSAEEYSRFLELPLAGINRCFQDDVKRLLGADYPFGAR